jgi:hypothetical protein
MVRMRQQKWVINSTQYIFNFFGNVLENMEMHLHMIEIERNKICYICTTVAVDYRGKLSKIHQWQI